MFRFLVLATVVSASTASAQVANYVAFAGYSHSGVTPVAPTTRTPPRVVGHGSALVAAFGTLREWHDLVRSSSSR